MTIIEFYDKTPLENIASALLCSPDKVILVGDDKKSLEKMNTELAARKEAVAETEA